MKKKKIICLGGGSAMPEAVLKGLKNHPSVTLYAVSAMLDSGGSSGRIRKDYNIVSPGDIRRAFLALANTSKSMEDFFNYRFQKGELKGHNLANLLIAGLHLSSNDYEEVRKEIHKILNINHYVFPSTINSVSLFAELESGEIIEGETNIDIAQHDSSIKKVFLKPKAKIYPPLKKIFEEADLIVMGPGDLYSSLIQILLVQGIPEAIMNSKAKKVYVCNLMTKKGETQNFKVEDFSNEVEKYLGGDLDYVLYNTQEINTEMLKKIRKERPVFLEMASFSSQLNPNKFIGRALLGEKPSLHNNSQKISKAILSLLG